MPGLYIVATPIGNLGDMTSRAAAVLSAADVIAAEDTRTTAKLLRHLGIRVPMVPYHDHSDDRARATLVDRAAHDVVALVSDAGTPLISDPGYKLVRDARAAGRRVVTVPGPCAAIAALTLAALPTDRFLFAGFLPPKDKARRDTLTELAGLRATLVFYESGPRLSASLTTMAGTLGDRPAAVARELTKLHEECVTGSLSDLAARYADAPPKGEIVVVVGPPGDAPRDASPDRVDDLLRAALADQPVARAAKAVAAATGLDRAVVYARALEIKGQM